mgnify:CR=1 FL=1
MNAVEIEEAISQLAEQPFDPATFPYAFLEGFGNKETTIRRLQSGATNATDIEGAVLQRNNIHIRVCHEGEVEQLLAELALHQLDIVLAGQPAPRNPNLRLTSERLVDSGVQWYGPAKLVGKAQREGFPLSLNNLPVLLPTGHSALRIALDHWFDTKGIRPRIVGEFEDSALLKTFGANGMGVFPSAEWVHEDLLTHYAVKRLGHCEGVTEHFFAIGTEKKVQHPLVLRLLQPAK